ncbi:IS1634 family transposase [Treponema sp.]|uniref:IS1634 family transposase n=1 Tax=Treponema sp. TaxID=166 RepID=UPI00298E5299|nr:IS1634 family transposase [Treponema sp.]
MRLNIVKSKNAEQLYIIKSIRKDGKSTTRIMRKLGTMASLLPKFDNDRDKVIAWAKEEAIKMTAAENSGNICVDVTFTEDRQLDSGKQYCFNIGYLFPKMICRQLNLDKISSNISEQHKISYSLSDVLQMLITTRLIAPASKLSSYEYASKFLQQPAFDLQHVYRSLDVLSQHSDEIQSAVYENSRKLIDRNKEVLFYDCTNYFFEIEEGRGIAQYGKSKEHRPNPIVQMGLFLDGDGFPLCFSMFPGNQNEQPTLKPLEKKILRDFNLSEFIVCTDAGLASTENRKFNAISGRSYIVTQSLKTLKDFLREWALDPNGWKLNGSDKLYNINEIDRQLHKNSIFCKERWINENGLEQRLIVSYSVKEHNYQRAIRERQIARAEKIVKEGFKSANRNQNSPKRFVSETRVTSDGEVADKKILSLDIDKIELEERFDGFYAVCTTLENDISEIIHINKMRWQIEAAFRTMKSEFKARPVYLRNDDRINAHFLTCFLSLLVLKIIEKKIGGKYSEEQILHTLRDMSVYHLRDIGYLSSYTRTEITDALHDAFGFRTDSEFISEKTMKKILRTVEKG